MKPHTTHKERRSGSDRRRAEKGPPGVRERRRTLEARKPEVSEIEMTASEWIALTELAPVPKK
jgi:hypothetical protein